VTYSFVAYNLSSWRIGWEQREMSLEYGGDDDIALSGVRNLELMQGQLSRYGKFIGWSLQSTVSKTAGGLTYRVGSRRLALRINYRSYEPVGLGVNLL
jgi:hypothetical protein